MTKKSRSIAVVTLLAPMAAGCKKSAASMSHDEKVATLDEPGKLQASSWKLDATHLVLVPDDGGAVEAFKVKCRRRNEAASRSSEVS